MKALAAVLVLIAGPAWADGHSVTIVNGTGNTIREIHIAPVGAGSGANRLRSTLPPHATADITYSTGCQAEVTLVFEGGQSERYADQNVCTGLRITAGQGVSVRGVVASPRGKPEAVARFQPPPHVDVPWTGRSITHKFGGLN